MATPTAAVADSGRHESFPELKTLLADRRPQLPPRSGLVDKARTELNGRPPRPSPGRRSGGKSQRIDRAKLSPGTEPQVAVPRGEDK